MFEELQRQTTAAQEEIWRRKARDNFWFIPDDNFWLISDDKARDKYCFIPDESRYYDMSMDANTTVEVRVERIAEVAEVKLELTFFYYY